MLHFIASFVVPFFFQSYDDHRELHSFPTRRSSDLFCCEDPRTRSPLATASSSNLVSKAITSFYRSEEHTSELQSHSDLVCRLLLEKKKGKAAGSSLSGRAAPPTSGLMGPYVTGRPR